jgi:predicted RecA/RadA family phage recombinase
MTGDTPGFLFPLPAEADYSSATGLGSQYKALVLDTDSGGSATAKVATGATLTFLGVLYNRPRSGEASTVVANGIAWVQVDSTTDIAVGDRLTANSSGIGVKTTTAGNYVLGLALAARTSNDVGLIPVLLTPGSTVPA